MIRYVYKKRLRIDFESMLQCKDIQITYRLNSGRAVIFGWQHIAKPKTFGLYGGGAVIAVI